MTRKTLLFTCVTVSLACGCGGGKDRRGDLPDGGGPDGGSTCVDDDGDGYGEGDCLGPDCNDEIDWVWEQADCDRLCEEAEGPMPGCACDSASNREPVRCYLADDPDTAGVGPCMPGLARCNDGVWGPCDGQVLPEDEQCDLLDNDCDGEVDEGVRSICGGCGECTELCWGPEEGCDEWGETRSESVVETAEGHLTLDATAASHPWIWLPAAGFGEVLLVNRETLEVEGHYQSGPGRPEGAFFGLIGDGPRMGAVDRHANFVVVNHAPLAQPSVTKIAVDASDCVDADGSGAIETSSGFGDLLPFEEEECILWNLVVGAEDEASKPGGIVVYTDMGLDGGLTELAWLAMTGSEKFVQIDVGAGDLTGEEVETPGFGPNEAQLDRDLSVWAASPGSNQVGHFDARAADPEATWETIEGPVEDLSMHVLRDENGATWVSGLFTVRRYDEGDDSWEDSGILGLFLGHAETDHAGSIWVAQSLGEVVHRIDYSGDELVTSLVPTPGTGAGGIEADPEGRVWVVGSQSGNVTIIDPNGDDGIETTRILDDCEGPCLNAASPYGDLSGSGYRHTNRPIGSWSTVASGCDEGTDWLRLEVGGGVPEGSALRLRLRTAETLEALPAAEWVLHEEAVGEADLDVVLAGVEDARLLEVEVVLLSGEEAPVLEVVRLRVECPFGLE